MRRLFDVIVSLILLVLLSPIFLILAIIIKLDSRGPVFFTQMRIGRENRLFKFYKFRTMTVGAPNVATEEFKDSKNYITSFGRILRKTSMDELPQLLNIFKGDMAFIGPRPALYNQYELKQLRTKKGVHKLLPGLTGWAQVNGRDMLNDEMKTSYDRYYLEHRSLGFDVKIIVRTVFKVLRCDGIIEGGRKAAVKSKSIVEDEVVNVEKDIRIEENAKNAKKQEDIESAAAK
jgi:O-antigen biosynthesis protein WbqP